MSALRRTYARDRRVWDDCAGVYEDRIVGGHPDVFAYEQFEEDLLDRVLLHLARECGKHITLYDVGCGSGRLHLRYGLKTVHPEELQPDDAARIRATRCGNPACAYDDLLAERLHSVGGIDFSAPMLEIAKRKLREGGLGGLLGERLRFDQGSAFELCPMEREPFPVVVSVCNSVGVMQGPEGAVELFKSVRRAVDDAGGVAVISGYRKEAVESFALGNYESTMDVCGQPRWLIPDTYAALGHKQVPRSYKRAYDSYPGVTVDVYDADDKLVKAGHILTRDDSAVREAVDSGHIRTYTDYESRWYSFDQFDEWVRTYWPEDGSYHIAGADLDSLRGEPSQLAILDPSGLLGELLARWSHGGKG